MKLDRAQWSVQKLARKCAKQVLWISCALLTGCSFVGYFTDIRELGSALLSFELGGWDLFWVGFYGFATYGNAGYMREQVCKYMCPYARFQGALFDRHTLVIAYDAARGEPRGSRPRNVDLRLRNLGDCLDCTLCVQACPTGIDIRKGLQLECIACAACIDACDSVMDEMPYPRGLIRYATLSAAKGAPARLWRARTVLYGGLLLLLSAGFAFAVATRQLIQLDVLRDRNALYRTLDDGHIENVYTLRIINKDAQPHTLELQVLGLTAAEWDCDAPSLQVPAGGVLSVPLRVRVPAGSVHGSVRIDLLMGSKDTPGLQTRSKGRFIAPVI